MGGAIDDGDETRGTSDAAGRRCDRARSVRVLRASGLRRSPRCAGASSLFDALQPWFLTAATLLLAVSAVQLYRSRGTCQRRGRRFSLTVLGLSATIVLLVLLFPQSVAGWIADYVL